MLEVLGAGFSYNGKEVLRSTSLQVAEGDFLGIIGPNGAGKSTLLRLMSRVLRPKGGEVRLHGRPLNGYSARELAHEMAVLPSETFYPYDFTVLEIARMGRLPHLGFWAGESERDAEIVRRSLEAVGIAGLSGRSIHSLSSGERQMAFLAQAMAQEPRILLLDEPTVHLDIRHQLEIFKLLKAWNQDRGLTIAVISHDLNVASRFCARLALMHGGRVCVEGPAKEVITETNLRQVYGIEVRVADNPETGLPAIHYV